MQPPPSNGQDTTSAQDMAARPRLRSALIPAFGVRRPVTVGVIFATMLVLGAVAYRQIPVQLVPSGYELPFLYVWLPTLPSHPHDLEEKVAVPVEDMLGTVRHVRRLRTRVRQSEVGFLIHFEDGTEMGEAYNDVRDRLERSMASLPDDVQRYFIWKYDPNDSPVYWFGLSLGPEAAADLADRQYELLDHHVARVVERVDGVTRVEMWGADKRIVRVSIDEARAQAAGTTTYQLIQRLRSDNFSLAAGTLTDNDQRVALRVLSRFESLDAIARLPIGNQHVLEDVADVAMTMEVSEQFSRLNGRDAVLFGVYKDASANSVDVCAEVTAVLHSLGDDEALRGFEVHDLSNQGDMILQSIDNLQSTALFGGFFAVLVLLVFLRQIRMTLIVALAIPVSLLVTVIVMYFTGFTLNVLTLMGLMLSVGMVVDNSIVVVENIQRHRFEGQPPTAAAIRGTAEVALALLVATSTTVVVFLPMILMSGNASLSFYLGKIGYPVCISLVASLFVSLLFVPLATLLGLAPDASTQPSQATGSGQLSPVMRWVEAAYARALRWVVEHRIDAAVLFVVISATIVVPWEEVQRTDQMQGMMGEIEVRFDIPAGMGLAERKAFFADTEEAIGELRQRFPIKTLLSRGGTGRNRIQVFLQDGTDQNTRQELVAALDEAIPVYPGIGHRVGWRGTSRSGEEAAVTLKLRGPESQRLAILGDEMVRRLSALPEVVSVEAEQNEDVVDELQLVVQREAAQRRGLAASVVGGVVDFSLRGRRLPDLRLGGAEIELWAKGEEADKESLMHVGLPTPQGQVALEQVARIRHARTLGSIHRENRSTVLDIKVNTTQDDLESLRASIDSVLAGVSMPRGYALDKGDRFRRMAEDQEEQAFALTLAIVFVFLLMGVLFESALLPLAIVFSIPFAFLGVYWMLYLTDTPFDVMAGVGLVILVGIVVNNAIVLVDTVHRLQPLIGPREAVVVGSVRRLRPVLMTALTTIFGLIPMAMGDAGIAGIPYAPLGRAVIGGLLASTLLTLFAVPYLYLLLMQGRTRLAGRAWIRRAPVQAAPAPPV